MKKHHKFGIIVSAAGCIVIYLLTSLVAASFNIKDWSLPERGFTAFAMIFYIVISFAIANDSNF